MSAVFGIDFGTSNSALSVSMDGNVSLLDVDRDRIAQDRLTRAAQIAGFKNISFQLEPIAAALAYENSLEAGTEQIVLVGDFGAGSSDFTIYKAGNHGGPKAARDRDILSAGGVYIGGDVFDSEIMREKVAVHYGKNVQAKSLWSDNLFGLSPLVIRKLTQWHLIPQLRLPRTLDNINELKVRAGFQDKKLLQNLENLIHANYGYLLFRSIERTKFELSEKKDSRISFKEYDICIDELLSREEFESFINDKVASLNACIDSTLAKAALSCSDIDVVFLTGGSSYIPLIRNIFETRIGKDKIRSADAFTSVAYGLGLQGNFMG